MIRNLIIIFSFFSGALFASDLRYADYDWNTFPQLPVSDTIKSLNGSLITSERRINEFYLNSENKYEEIVILHRKIRVETHDAIDRFNKIYVPVSNVLEVLSVKARFISPQGKITELPKESIKQIENLENKGDFQIFAIEGAEIGGEIEYLYILRKNLNAYGSVTFQGSDPKANVEAIYCYPSKLEFIVKSYNGLPQFTESSDTLSGINYLKMNINYIPGISDERYSAYDASLMRLEYTLAHNKSESILRLYSFNKAASNIYNNFYLMTKDEKSSVNDVIKKLQLTKLSEEDKIRKIENWLKNEMVVSDEVSGDLSIREMLKLKQTNDFGITRLFISFLNELSINFELAFTCNQTERKFDPDFNGWNYLNEYLIYFPAIDEYICPDDLSYRLGLTPSYFQNSYGLFLHPVKYGELATLGYDVKKISQKSYLENSDSLDIKLKINAERLNVDADIKRVFTGELAATFQSFWKLNDSFRQSEIIREVFNMGAQNNEIHSFNLTNCAPNDIGVKPIIFNVKLSANSLIEQAGDDILMKIGESIGEQIEMYQEAKRKLPVYVGSLHNYYRKIEFEIPEGYSVSNTENLKMNVEMIKGNKVSCCFKSDYEVKGNKLYVYSTEYYSEMEYPLEDFEKFKDVINAAADFNKRTILLIKAKNEETSGL